MAERWRTYGRRLAKARELSARERDGVLEVAHRTVEPRARRRAGFRTPPLPIALAALRRFLRQAR